VELLYGGVKATISNTLKKQTISHTLKNSDILIPTAENFKIESLLENHLVK